jgi:dolichol-phosphate mannosyltransferase
MARRYSMFCLVGATGLAVDTGVLCLLSSPTYMGWDLSLSKAVAAEVAIINNFLWNDLWTFRSLGGSRTMDTGLWIRLAKFNLICAAGIGWSVLVLNVQVRGMGLDVYFANFVSIVLVSFWNFLLNLKFGWYKALSPKGSRASAK